MSEVMVRKQVYLPRSQNQKLKRLARQRGVSEAEVIRQALEREVEGSGTRVQDGRKALEKLVRFARSLREQPEFTQGQAYHFDRDEIYNERESRWERGK